MKKVFTEVLEEALLAMKNSAEAVAATQVMKIFLRDRGTKFFNYSV